MFRRILVLAALTSIVVMPSVVQAQALAERPAVNVNSIVGTTLLQPVRIAAVPMAAPLLLPNASVMGRSKWTDRSLMSSLYVTTAAMQMMDVHSTIKAMNVGAVESNVMMGGLVEHRAAFVASKAAMAAVTIYAAHRMAKHNKVAAVVTLVALNSAYAMIVSNNYKIAGR